MGDDRRDGSDDLDQRIAAAKAAHTRGAPDPEARAESRGWAIGIEFVGAVLVSGFIGWGIDNYAGFGTKPWAMVIMLLLGFAAGTHRAMKMSVSFDADPANDNKE